MSWPLEWVFRRVVDQHRVALDILSALSKRPGYDADLPLVGCPVLGDCREFGCAGYCSEADEPQSSADYQRGQRIGSAEPPAEGAGQPPRPPSAGVPNLDQPDPSEMHMWPDWLLFMYAANSLPMSPRHAQLIDELRKRADLDRSGGTSGGFW